MKDRNTVSEWRTLRQLVRYRMLLAAISLPLGFLLGPGPLMASHAQSMLAVSVVVVAFSGLCILGLHWGRYPRVQMAVQVAIDVLLVSWVAMETGGRHSQFVLFYVLVVLYSGMIFATRGGTMTAFGVACAYLSLPWFDPERQAGSIGEMFGEMVRDPSWPLAAGLFVAVGVLGGILGKNARRQSQNLAEAAREVQQVRLDTERILASMSSGVLTLDKDLTVLHTNQAAAEVLGIPTTELRGRRCGEVLGDEQHELLARVRRTLETGLAEHRQEISIHDRNGVERPLGLSTSILTDERGKKRGVVAVFADLSDYKAIEARARRSETLAALGQLSAAVAHEIRNAVVPLSGSVDILQGSLRLEGEDKRLMELISRESDRLNRFVSELLDFVREGQLHEEDVQLNELVEDVIGLARRHPLAEGVRLTVRDGGVSHVARADGEQLKRAFVNLAQNAVEAMDGKGELVVVVESRGDRVRVAFRDNGPGIEPEDQARILEPFFTTKRGGTGLGLATAARVVERIGGQLRVQSEPGEGTTITVELPQVESTSLAA